MFCVGSITFLLVVMVVARMKNRKPWFIAIVLYCAIGLLDVAFAGIEISAILRMFILILPLCFLYIEMVKAEKALKEENRQFMEEQKRYYDEILSKERETEIETRKFRHDIKNHLFVMKRLFEDNHIADGLRYLQNVLEESSKLGISVETGNCILNIVVEDIIKEEDEIVLRWNGVFPKRTKISDSDLCILFSNILKNAKEEVIELPEKEIVVTIKAWQNSLCVECVNMVNCNRIHTNVEKGKGLGLLNVKNVVKKYDGDMEVQSNEKYIIKILLYDVIVLL